MTEVSSPPSSSSVITIISLKQGLSGSEWSGNCLDTVSPKLADISPGNGVYIKGVPHPVTPPSLPPALESESLDYRLLLWTPPPSKNIRRGFLLLCGFWFSLETPTMFPFSGLRPQLSLEPCCATGILSVCPWGYNSPDPESSAMCLFRPFTSSKMIRLDWLQTEATCPSSHSFRVAFRPDGGDWNTSKLTLYCSRYSTGGGGDAACDFVG